MTPFAWVKNFELFLSNFLLLSENYESLAHEIDPAEPGEDTWFGQVSKISVFKLERKKFDIKIRSFWLM